MRWISLATTLLLPLACTRANPGFGDGEGSGSASEGSSSTSPDPTVASASASQSDSDDPSADTSDVGPDSDSMDPSTDSESESDTSPEPYCGDEHVDLGEACDAGPEGSEECTPDCQLRSCGDGVVQEPEQCEPALSPEHCTMKCQHNMCGDGEMLESEECDDKNNDMTDDCVECATAFCGDGFLHANEEECDDADDDDGDECTSACLVAACGDGFVHQGVEQCDGGEVPSCESVGLQGIAVACDQMTCTIIGCGDCGNGVIEPNEYCEVGDILTCEQLNLGGEDEIVCGKDCQPEGPGECCQPQGQPCVMGVPCCGSCNGEICGD